MAVYLQVEYGTGALYEYSKDAKENFVEHTNTKGAVSYRRVLNKGLYGKVTNVQRKDSNFGDQISITVVDENGTTNYVSIPMFDAQQNLSNYAEGFIVNLKGLVVGETYRIYPYAIETDSGYTNRGISIKKADLNSLTVTDQIEKYTQSYVKDGEEVEGDIPKVEWKQKMGKNVMDKDNKNDFLFKMFEKFISGDKQADIPKETKKQNAKPKQEPSEDDLPF